jgi:hypothetical protein
MVDSDFIEIKGKTKKRFHHGGTEGTEETYIMLQSLEAIGA